MNEKQRTVSRIALASGALLRMWYLFVWHRANDHVYSDMAGYVEWAKRFFDPNTIADTIHAPGTPLYYGVLYLLDPHWNLAIMAQWLLCVGSMLLLGRIGALCYGGWVGPLTLVAAAAYFPFTHYASFFLAENPFMFFLLLGFVATLHADRARSILRALGWGLGAGLACGVAAAFKNAVLGALLVTGTGYMALCVRQRRRAWIPIALGTLMGLAALHVPMAMRCTRLAGHFCMAASNTGMNMLIGHYGKKGPFYWEDHPRNITFMFQSPTSSLRGYKEAVHLPFGAYDSESNFRALRSYLLQNPLEALELSVDHVWELFAMPTLWPSGTYGPIDWGATFQHVYWYAILAPGLLYLLVCASRRTPYRLGSQEVLLMLPLVGIMLTVFLSVAEVRYRIPFDGLMMVLAARAYTVAYSELSVRRKQRRRHLQRLAEESTQPL